MTWARAAGYVYRLQDGSGDPSTSPGETGSMDAPLHIRLGAFRLSTALGSGGQGTVWAAEHVDTGIRAAVKILTGDRARKPRALGAFRREVRAAARLDHPNTIQVLDQGELPATASHTDPRLTPGSPYLVMGRAACSLAMVGPPQRWSHIQAVLHGVLDGLIHAHARGVLHRDVKPGNILFPVRPETPDDFRAACLADFGLAVDRTLGVPLDGIATAGSPAFMAPEQFTGDSAEIGVETDLYAVGWLAWWMVARDAPFGHDTIQSIRKQKISGRLPPWPDSGHIPPGLQAWVFRLLETDPLRRFSSAAAARAALDTLDATDSGLQPPPASPTQRVHSDPTLDFLTLAGPSDDRSQWDPSTPTLHESGSTTEVAPDIDPYEVARALGQHGPAALQFLPLPEHYPVAPPNEHWHLSGTGLALYGLRVTRPVGREGVLEALWADLRSTTELGLARHVLVHGPAEVGRTTVLRELAWAASSTGAVIVLEVRATDGIWSLSRTLARYFGVVGLHPVDQERRLARRLRQMGLDDPVDIAAVMRLVRWPETGTMARPTDSTEACRALIAAMTRRAPVLVIADDIDRLDTTARDVLRSVGGQALVVWSCRDEVAHGTSATGAFLERLAPIGRPLRPLTTDEIRRSVQEAAGLAPPFARHVAELAEGNPGLAHHIVADLIGRGALQLDAQGWTCPQLSTRTLAQVDAAGWDLHLDRMADRHGPHALEAFAAAAALGHRMERRAWKRVVARLELSVPSGLLDDWADHGLVRLERRGEHIEFVHPVLRQRALSRSALGRPHLHGVCAETVEAMGGDAATIGEQLLLAHRPAEALEPLLQALERSLDGIGSSSPTHLEQLAAGCVDTLQLPDDHPGAARLRLLRARVAVQLAAFTDAAALVQPLVDAHPIHDAVGAQARLVRIMAALGVMDLPTVHALGPPLLDALPARSTEHLKARLVIGTAASYAGQGARAQEWLEPAVDPRSTSLLQGRLRVQLAIAHKSRGEPARALAHVDAAVDIFEHHAARRWLGQALNERGDLHRYRGDLGRASRDYQRAEALFGVLATPYALAPRINGALVSLARDRYDQAETTLRLAYGSATQLGLSGYAYAACFGLLAATAGRGDPTSYDEALGNLGHLASTAHFADADLAECAERSGRLWLSRSDFRRAESALNRARDMWTELGKSDRSATLDALLSEALAPRSGGGPELRGSVPPSTPR